MKSIFLTGGSGFVGASLIEYFKSYVFVKHVRLSPVDIKEEVVIHLAGKAHDTRKSSDPSEYYLANTEFTKELFDAFLISEAKVFITLSSVKAVSDYVEGFLTEDHPVNPQSHYGKSKLLAEQYILSRKIPEGKSIFILRPCMIHGPGNKGNLNSLYKLASKGIPWPLGAYDNRRSFCSIENLLFIVKELIERDDIPSGVYNVADDEALSINEVILILAQSQNREARIWKISKNIVHLVTKLGDLLNSPLTTERLQKLTESYVVSNQKLKNFIGKPLPVSAQEGLLMTFNSFNQSAH